MASTVMSIYYSDGYILGILLLLSFYHRDCIFMYRKLDALAYKCEALIVSL